MESRDRNGAGRGGYGAGLELSWQVAGLKLCGAGGMRGGLRV